MLDLDTILYGLTNNLHPVIQREDGLYTTCYDIYPDETLGTNLAGYYPTNDGNVYFTLSGEWDSVSYNYDSDTGKWTYNIEIPIV